MVLSYFMKLTPAEAGYLAGLIDGEGSLTITVSRRPQLQSNLVINNCNRAIIDYAAALLTKMNVPFSINGRRKPGSTRWKKPWAITVNARFVHMTRLLLVLKPYIIGKAEQVELVLAFCRRRTAYDYFARSKRTARGTTSYSTDDIATINRLRELNFRGLLEEGETMPQLVCIKPPTWSRDGVLYSDYWSATRATKRKHSP